MRLVDRILVSLGFKDDEDEDGYVVFPHCDPRILHAPGECEYCDLHPEWQDLRESWQIAFTGHGAGFSIRPNNPEGRPVDGALLPCPADVARPPLSPSDHRRWPGNQADPVIAGYARLAAAEQLRRRSR